MGENNVDHVAQAGRGKVFHQPIVEKLHAIDGNGCGNKHGIMQHLAQYMVTRA